MQVKIHATNQMMFSRHRWPPIPTLLSEFSHLALKAKKSWDVDDWKEYAHFLEYSGQFLITELQRFESLLRVEKKKHSRSKNPKRNLPEFSGTLLTGLNLIEPRPRRGRKPNGRTVQIATEALEIRAQLESAGRRVTDKIALGQWYVNQGQRRSRADSQRNILNFMSKIRRNHKISQS